MASSEAAGNPLIIINLFFGLSSSNEEQNHQNLTHSFFSIEIILAKAENVFFFPYSV